MIQSIPHEGQFSEYIDSLVGKGQYWFTKAKLKKELGLSGSAMNIALWRSSQKSRLCRIKNDFYVIVTPEHRTAGCLPARWFIDPLMKYLELPYYVGLLSAASLWGAAHQQVMMLQVITNQQMRPITVGNQHIQFHYKRELEEKHLESKKTPLSYFQLSNPALTLFDLIKYVDGEGQLQLAATVIYELIEETKFDSIIELASGNQISLPVVQRLGYILDKVVRSELDLFLLEEAINQRKPRYIPLVGSRDGVEYVKDTRWHVLVDAHLELDDL